MLRISSRNRPKWRHALFIPLCSLAGMVFFVAACNTSGGEDMAPHFDCDLERSSLEVNEASDLDFSAQDVLDALPTSGSQTLEWTEEFDGEDASLDWTFTVDEDAVEFVEEMKADPDHPEGCDDQFIAIGGAIEFKTDDGSLDELVDVQWEARGVEEAAFESAIFVDDLGGSLTLSANPDDIIQFHGEVESVAMSGMILLDSYSEDVDSLTDEALAKIASWGTE